MREDWSVAPGAELLDRPDISVIEHDMDSDDLEIALAIVESDCECPEVLTERLADAGLGCGWTAITADDPNLLVDIADYDVGTFARLRINRRTFIIWRFTPTATADQLKAAKWAAKQEEAGEASLSRSYRYWSSEEMENLRLGHDRFGNNWARILSEYKFDHRSAVHLRQKWRNMSKHANASEP
ncbi:Myb-like DNA-binding domain containing protein [Plasmodiophora brassicae]|uniref:Uncharacterized protein n=1 Tax=Plasmodiophora brassicae TaxID=37360 RepID=A0A0G4J3W1_PLABS|nr:hypothetical protein PBRA_002231 [Plasmodiophora brassicae]